MTIYKIKWANNVSVSFKIKSKIWSLNLWHPDYSLIIFDNNLVLIFVRNLITKLNQVIHFAIDFKHFLVQACVIFPPNFRLIRSLLMLLLCNHSHNDKQLINFIKHPLEAAVFTYHSFEELFIVSSTNVAIFIHNWLLSVTLWIINWWRLVII